tara:strand:- start:1403 stop:2263 length:861 start_codon:yes stop_codon:yes gene_type:complete
MSQNNVQFVPSEDLVGGDVLGLDLSQPLEESTATALKRFFYERSVICIRDQTLQPEDQLRVARLFGEPDVHFKTQYSHPEHQQVMLISNIIEDGRHIGYADAGRVWHSDGSYMQTPVAVTLLYALEVPIEDGVALGDTHFASAWAAFDDLPAETKRWAASHEAIHEVGGRRRAIATGEQHDRDQDDEHPDAVHPLVRVHPETGRRYIFVNEGECTHVVGLDDSLALPRLQQLARAVYQPQYQFTHRWHEGDLLLWDNCAVQHLASFDYEWPRHRRHMHRITVPEVA